MAVVVVVAVVRRKSAIVRIEPGVAGTVVHGDAIINVK